MGPGPVSIRNESGAVITGKRLKIMIFVCLFFLLVPLARGAGGTGDTLESSQKGDHRRVLRLGLDVPDFENLDPHFAAGYPDRLVVDMIYNALVRYSPGNVPNIEPDLARNIPEPFLEDGRQVWIFQLKSGVFFHSGPVCPAHELTADDVVFSLGKAADPTSSRYAGSYTGLTVEKIDDFTVKIISEKPLSPRLFLSRIANYSGGFIMSREGGRGKDGGGGHPDQARRDRSVLLR